MKTAAKSMVLAAFLGDSLALGAHWIYDTEQIFNRFGNISGLLAPDTDSYHPTKKRGEFTHYGDQTLLLLRNLRDHQGEFNLRSFAGDWQTFFHGYSGYIDKASRTTLENLDSGKNVDVCASSSTDLGGPVRIAPLIYLYRDNLDMLLKSAKAQTALTHRGPGVESGVIFLATSCHAILHGASPREAFNSALEGGPLDMDLDLRIRRSLEDNDREVLSRVKEFGQMCAINAALPGAIHTILHHETNLKTALVDTVQAGGDSAARAMVVGMVLGAWLGEKSVPERWLQEMAAYKEIVEALDQLP